MPLALLQPDLKPFILCIEDNQTYLRLRKAVLEQAGYAVLSATTESEALELLREAPVCLVLSDHMLRGTTGTELAKKMKRIKGTVPHHRVLRDGARNVAARRRLHQQR